MIMFFCSRGGVGLVWSVPRFGYEFHATIIWFSFCAKVSMAVDNFTGLEIEDI